MIFLIRGEVFICFLNRLGKARTAVRVRFSPLVWSAGETLDAELWLLNDSAESVSGKVSAYITVGEKTIHMLDWDDETQANSNVQGPTARVVLPDEEACALVLTLKAENGLSSTYTLKYIPKTAKNPAQKILNM